MIAYQFDTTVFIQHLRNPTESVGYIKKLGGTIGLSYITYGEIVQGIRTQRHRDQINNLLSRCELIWGSRSVEKKAISLLEENVMRGMGLFDALIAATAIENNLTLITHNIKHFSNVEGLRVQLPDYVV